jgi:hypothetical protein
MIVIDGGTLSDNASGGIFVRSKSSWIDLPKTMEVQSRWNGWAAWFSAARSLNRHVGRVFDPSRKDHHWGRGKLADR